MTLDTTKFVFDEANLNKCNEIIKHYPADKKRSAILPLLDLAQRQNGGFLSQYVIEYIASILEIAPIRVYEIVTFYTMFNLRPVGEYHIQVCGTTPCWLRGAEGIATACKKALGIEFGDITADKKFSLVEVECLGACVNAPVVQINDDYFENLTEEKMIELIEELRSKKP